MIQQQELNNAIKKCEYFLNKVKNLDEYILQISSTYDNLEKYLYYKEFNVLSLFKDSGNNDGDDGGYIISISKKDEKFYLHILEANYNGKLKYYNLDNNEVEEKCFYIFSESKQLEIFLNKFVDDLEYCVNEEKKDEDFYGESNEEFQELSKKHNLNWDENYCDQLRLCFFSFKENSDETEIRRLCSLKTFSENASILKLKKTLFEQDFELTKTKIDILANRLENNNFKNFDKNDLNKISTYIEKNYLKDIPKKYIINSIEYLLLGYCDYFVLDFIDYNPKLTLDKLKRPRFNQWYKNYIEPKRFKNETKYIEEFAKEKIDLAEIIKITLIVYLDELFG